MIDLDLEADLAAGFPAALEELKRFCRIPSVSTDPAYRSGIADAAAWVAARLRQAGFPQVETIATGGHPLVLAEWHATPGAPTILVYGHYDVQPPDPIANWTSPPFDPVVRADRLYARGVSDDKGPLLIPILVAEAMSRRRGRLPVNLVVLIEGEEESGSPHFEPAVAALKPRLACDLAVSADGAMWRPDLPSVTVASRGLVALDVVLTGAAKDLHSGRHGGSAPNPLQALVRLLATLHDHEGRVAVPGFHDGVRPPDPAILAAIRQADFDPAAYYAGIGAVPPVPMPDGDALLVRQWLEPTLEFNGIAGGYAGPGTKTVIPATAQAKITCRLVAGQVPAAVLDAVRRHLAAHAPSGFRLEMPGHGSGTPAFALDPGLPGLAATEAVLAEVLGQAPLRVAMGATVPIGGVLERQLGVPTVFFSFSTSDEDYHAPNEFFRLENFRRGLVAWARLLDRLVDLPRKREP
ncbi:dipeptidase [Lichenihabitans sp. Uapishka_5]|uniref:dipeptidase n=1 Tax=Lichenihabitans sp. Uapishka_5 TaxID=3037302 RepID=UPI0029E7D51B|nr:dipeptidase [Lichenihabitans sp. Uapishka_5]MDX7950512.1 dipeptidase [Lichenihabitans sp. Uapishka_5]